MQRLYAVSFYLKNIGGVFAGGDVDHGKFDGVKEGLKMYDNFLKEQKGIGGDHVTIAGK